MRCVFPPDHVHTASEARAAAVASMHWRQSLYPIRQPVLRPVAPPIVPRRGAANDNKPNARSLTERGRWRARDIIGVACLCFGISRDELIGHGRQARLVIPRHAAMAVAHRLTGKSMVQIGKQFGGRDHTSVLHVVRKAKEQRHPKLQAAIEELLTALKIDAAGPADAEGASHG